MASNNLYIVHVSCCFSGPEGQRSQLLVWVLLTHGQKPANMIYGISISGKEISRGPFPVIFWLDDAD